jgi:hypothetical protein
MVAHISQLFMEYEERLRRMQHVPGFSYGRQLLRDDGGPNRFFLTYLFSDQAMPIELLKNVGLLQSKMPCKTHSQDMTWSADSSRREGFHWRC